MHHATPTRVAQGGFFDELTNHQHESGVVDLDRATRQQLDAQLAGTQTLVERYPTIGDAEAAGPRSCAAGAAASCSR